jgi:hypothetical protein
MPISEKEHFDALRAADQRAIELLAKANGDRIKTGMLVTSILVSVISVLVAIATIIIHR